MGFPFVRLFLAVTLLLQASAARQLRAGAVTGILRTNAGLPMEGVRVAVEPVDNALDAGVLESIGLTDKTGRYLLENVSPGRYHIVTGRIGAALYHPGVTEPEHATTIVVAAGETTEAADMVFKRTKISGSVVDINTGKGRRIDSLILCCDYGQIAGGGTSFLGVTFISASPLVANVNDDGTFVFGAVPPGNYYLRVSGSGIVPMASAISVGDEDMPGVEVKVTAGVTVRGHIADRLNEPVFSVMVTLKADARNAAFESTGKAPGDGAIITGDPGRVRPSLATIVSQIQGSNKPRTVTATAEGTFSFDGVLPGKYFLEMNAPGGNSFGREIDVGAGEPVDTLLDVPFTQVTGRIVMEDGSALPALSGSVRFVSSDPDARILFGFPDDAGRFSMLMAPGEYRLFTDTLSVDRSIQSISDGATDLRAQRFVVDGTHRQEIRITVEP